MFDSTEELLRKIRLGEDTSLELKAVRFKGQRISGPARDDLGNEIAAIANTHDGVLLLGIDDKTRDIEGIPADLLEVVERYVFEVCNDSIEPPVMFRCFRIELPDNTGTLQPILKVEIPRSLFVHEGPGGYFYRQGSSKRKMPPDYLARLFQQRSQARLIRFEEQPVPGTSLDDLSEALCRRYTTRSNEPDEVVLLKRNLLADEESGLRRCSVAGVLLCLTTKISAWMVIGVTVVMLLRWLGISRRLLLAAGTVGVLLLGIAATWLLAPAGAAHWYRQFVPWDEAGDAQLADIDEDARIGRRALLLQSDDVDRPVLQYLPETLLPEKVLLVGYFSRFVLVPKGNMFFLGLFE